MNHADWIKQKALNIQCPPCAGKPRPDLLANHFVQVPCICPTCKRVWVYKVNQTPEVSKRRTRWFYSANQPFIERP